MLEHTKTVRSLILASILLIGGCGKNDDTDLLTRPTVNATNTLSFQLNTDQEIPVEGATLKLIQGAQQWTPLTDNKGWTDEIEIASGSDVLVTISETTTPLGALLGQTFSITPDPEIKGWNLHYYAPTVNPVTFDFSYATYSVFNSRWVAYAGNDSANYDFDAQVGILRDSQFVHAFTDYMNVARIENALQALVIKTETDVDLGEDLLNMMIDASGHNYGDAPTMIAQHLESTDGSSDLNVTFRALSAYSDQGMGEAPSMTNKGITIDVTGTFRAGTNVIFFLPEVTGSGAKMPSHETSLMTESTSPIVNPVFAKESYQNCTKEDFEAQLEGACGEEEEPACTPGGSYPADPPPECKTTTELDALDKVYCNHTTSPAGKDLKTEWSGTTTAGGGVSGVASVEVSVTGTVSTVTRATAQPGECLTNFRCLSTCSVECEKSYFYISFLAGIGWGTRTATCACAVQGASGPVTCQMQKG